MEYDKFDDAVPEAVKRLVEMHEANSIPIKAYQTWDVMTWFGMAFGGALIFAGKGFLGYGVLLLVGSIVWRLTLKQGYEKALSRKADINDMIEKCGWIYYDFSGSLQKKSIDSTAPGNKALNDAPE